MEAIADKWARVDRSISEAQERLGQASTEEQFQAIGLLCRETLISLARAVYDPTLHPPPDGVPPSEADAKRMLEAYLAHELAGSANEAARRQAKATLDLANELQHKRTASFRDADLCLEVTNNLVNLIARISGQVDRTATSDVQVEFSYRGMTFSHEEHQYQLEVTVINRGRQAVHDFKLEFAFPDLDAIPQRWIPLGGEWGTAGQLVEIKPGDSTVSVHRDRYAVRVTYRSRDMLFPQDKLNLGDAIGLRYRVNVYANLEDMPPITWTLYVDNMQPKQGEVSLTKLHNY